MSVLIISCCRNDFEGERCEEYEGYNIRDVGNAIIATIRTSTTLLVYQYQRSPSHRIVQKTVRDSLANTQSIACLLKR